jgi:Holliday junction resolvase
MTALKLWQIGFSDFFSGGGLYNFLPENPRPCADRPETVAQQLDYLNLVTIPVDAHRLIQDVLAQVGWQSDPAQIGEKVKRLDIGLPCEDEFSVVCAWLGKCKLLHKLDQQQIPVVSAKEYQVPDLLAVFDPQRVKSPVLIEVKSKKAQTLSFKPDYLDKHKKYAELLKLPLLIAFKQKIRLSHFPSRAAHHARLRFEGSREKK